MTARISLISFAIVLVASAFPLVAAAESAPPEMTIAQELHRTDVAVIARLVDGTPTELAEDGSIIAPGSTRFEVVHVLKQTEGTAVAPPMIELRRFHDQPAGSICLIYGVLAPTLEWLPPHLLSEAGESYVLDLAALEVSGADRLRHFIPYLEHEDPLIARDVLLEFAHADQHDVVAVIPEIGADRLAEWVLADTTRPEHLGFYGWMLGMTGATEHAPAIREKLLQPSESFRLGIEGVMTGYVLLTGLEGWELIEQEKLLNREAPFSETYAAIQSLRYLLMHPPEGVPRDRLLESARAMLDRPEIADIVITDLARWQDWSVVDRLFALYDVEDFQEPAIQRGIVRYLMHAELAGAEADGDAVPEYAEQASRYLAQITARDPEIVKKVRMYFMPPDPSADATPRPAPWYEHLLMTNGFRC